METSNLAGEPSALARLAERALGAAEPAARRLRDARAAGVLFLLLAVYGMVVVRSSGDQQSQVTQLAMIAGWAMSALVCFVAPVRRLRSSWLNLVPAAVAVGSLGLGVGALAGALHTYQLAFAVVFGYLGLVARPAMLGPAAAFAEFCLLLAATLGHQHQQVPVLFAAIAASALIVGGGVAALVSWIEITWYRMSLLRSGAELVATATGETETAESIADLACELCGADSAAVLLTESPGSTLLIMRASTEVADDLPDVRIDVAREQSGNGVVLRTGAPLFISDAGSSPVPSARLMADRRIGSLLFLPIPGENGMLGTVTLCWRRRIEQVPPIAAELVETLPYLAGSALHRVRREARLDPAIMRDPVTGVDNRHRFDMVLAELPVAGTLLLFELDGYAELLADAGGESGVEVLRAFATALRRTVRDNDLVARIDDATFAVILPAGSSSIASGIIMQRLQRGWPSPHGVGFCAGVAIRDEHEPPSEVFSRAGVDLNATRRLKTSWDG